jgi:hypothetical protein
MVGRAEATSLLFISSLSSVFAYIIYSLFLHTTPAVTIVCGMFFVEAAYLAIRFSYAWHPLLVFQHATKHTVWATSSTLLYWYAFWYGMTAHPNQASIALAFLSLMIFGTPIALRLASFGPPLLRTRFISAAILVVAGVCLIDIAKANPAVTVGSLLDHSFWWSMFSSLYLDSTIAFLLVVVAQGATYVCRSDYLKDEEKVAKAMREAGLFARARRRGREIAVKDWNGPLSVAFLLSFLISVAVLICRAGFGSVGRSTLAWQDFWIAAMALFGLLFPTSIVNHLTARRKMAPAMTEPWLAVRPLLYVILAYLISVLLQFADISCVNNETCKLDVFKIHFGDVNPDLVSKLSSLYWIGLILGGAGFLILNWPAWLRVDGFVDQKAREAGAP